MVVLFVLHETFEPPSISNISVSPQFSFYGAKMRVEFTGSCLKQPKISYTHKKSSKHLHCL